MVEGSSHMVKPQAHFHHKFLAYLPAILYVKIQRILIARRNVAIGRLLISLIVPQTRIGITIAGIQRITGVAREIVGAHVSASTERFRLVVLLPENAELKRVSSENL